MLSDLTEIQFLLLLAFIVLAFATLATASFVLLPGIWSVPARDQIRVLPSGGTDSHISSKGNDTNS
jgi:hypothetical protein